MSEQPDAKPKLDLSGPKLIAVWAAEHSTTMNLQISPNIDGGQIADLADTLRMMSEIIHGANATDLLQQLQQRGPLLPLPGQTPQ
jgi:hypothetical protein